MNKLFLIDGHALIFKMYYAFAGHPMVNSKGVDTSILFGFTKCLLEIFEKEKPSHAAVFFDPPGGSFRNKMFPAYKANRSETPQLVIDALEPLTTIVKAMDIPVLMISGFEADDVLGAMAKRSAREGFEVYMVSPDKDYGQLVEPAIFQYKLGKNGAEVYGPKEICEKWGLDNCQQVIDMLTLCGDSADNVPGVAGIGPVSASKLLLKYGSVENIYEHLSELTSSQQAKFNDAKDHIALSKQLVTIKTDIDLDVTAEDMVLDLKITPALSSLFDLYEFNSLRRRSVWSASSDNSLSDNNLPDARLGEKANRDSSNALGISEMTDHALPGAMADFVEKVKPELVGYDVKDKLKESPVDGPVWDVKLMHYLLNPEADHDLGDLCRKYLGIELENETQQDDIFASAEADDEKRQEAIEKLAPVLRAELYSQGMLDLYDNVEEPLLKVLARMETTGVRIDPAALKEFSDGLRRQMLEEEKAVRDISDDPALNVSSPKQIGQVIFEKLALDPKAKKPRSGNWPTDEQTLSELSDRSPIIGHILQYRTLRKLLSTYIDPIPGYISPMDGRVHSTFNQMVTSTGRLSSSSPNLQNIPIRTELGREIRKAFVASEEDSVIMSADYSQIELRIMAHLCGDENMIKAFRDGVDIHSAMAATIFHKGVDEVTSADRRIAKTANFGIMYGISAFGLAQRLGCPRQEAKEIIDGYFASFPSIRGFLDKTLQEARDNGYVQTMWKRRRYTPDITSSNGQIRAIAERNAINAPIQGSAADIIKMAMIRVDETLRQKGLKSRLVLQIHDELLLEVPSDEIETVKSMLVEQMENVAELSVPLTVECNYGKTWLEAH